MLLKADADGPNGTDQKIAEAFGCRTKTVENVRQRLVERGFEETLNGDRRATPPVEKLLDGNQEAEVIATRLGPPPEGDANWTLRLLARQVVELEIVESVSYETVRRTLKKRDDEPQDRVLGRVNFKMARRSPTPSLWRTWKKSWKPTQNRTIRPVRCCAWKQVLPPIDQ